jgi:hypothetical protein
MCSNQEINSSSAFLTFVKQQYKTYCPSEKKSPCIRTGAWKKLKIANFILF